MMVAPELLEQKNKEKKIGISGQMSLFDFADEDTRDDFRITMPNVEEYPKEELLALEKETLGIYVSGHPMDAYESVWRKNITATAADFVVDEETERAKVEDNSMVTIGGMVSGKVVKTTRNGQMMAFITLEDMLGSVEVLVFPNVYEKQRGLFAEEEKLFIQGRVSMGEEPVGKLVCSQVIPFRDIPKELWIQYENLEEYRAKETELFELLRNQEGKDTVILYLKQEKAKKKLPSNWNVRADGELLDKLTKKLGEKNVRLVEKGIEKLRKMG